MPDKAISSTHPSKAMPSAKKNSNSQHGRRARREKLGGIQHVMCCCFIYVVVLCLCIAKRTKRLLEEQVLLGKIFFAHNNVLREQHAYKTKPTWPWTKEAAGRAGEEDVSWSKVRGKFNTCFCNKKKCNQLARLDVAGAWLQAAELQNAKGELEQKLLGLCWVVY